ncbi:MAG: hypothetical protein AAGH79_17890 [Bacteroidota bacterium]
MKPLFMLLLLACTGLYACQESQTSEKSKENPWVGTTWEYLDGVPIKFRKPGALKRSSRYRIYKDLPSVAEDSVLLLLLQNSLEAMEYQDREIDVFIDTTTEFRLMTMSNMPRMAFNAVDATVLKTMIKRRMEQADIENPLIEFGPLKASMKNSKTIQLARFQYTMTNSLDQMQLQETHYFLTGPSFSLYVWELADSPVEIEKYLWSLKT